ncbi:MAG TPA: histidine kinase [Bacteroidia bacterium]|nr:histidine kinase [Bacteroidia bacterium]
MFSPFKTLVLVLFTALFCSLQAQNALVPKARFSFNQRSTSDEIGKLPAKLIGASFTEDRFGNANHAVYLFGNEFSCLNLGNSPALKPKNGSVSLWVKLEREVYTGTGYTVNPIILTKGSQRDDFYEAYGIYYQPDSKKLSASAARDSLRQVGVISHEVFSLHEWHHLVITYDYNYFSLYVDGILQRKAIKKYETRFLESDSVLLGFTANKKNNRYSEGAFDDIEFYDKVLSEAEVWALYQAPNPNQTKLIIRQVGNGFLIGIGALILYLLVRLQFKRRLKREQERLQLKTKLLETELRVNRALMNPHFIFNSLNAIQDLILNGHNEEASDYLIKFSKLVRKILESNNSELISLATEIDILNRYLEIEELRFGKGFIHRIELGLDLVPAKVYIPIMMIQPFVENAIWHGLIKKEGQKMLFIRFKKIGPDQMLCEIDDNGIGRSVQQNDEVEPKKSLAIIFIKSRLDLFNAMNKQHNSVEIIDKANNSGTLVRIVMPIKSDDHA